MGKKRVFSKKTQAESGLKSKISLVVVLFSILFLVGFVSAGELITFDNVKTYDAIEQKVTIVNTFRLGRTIADVKLDTPLINRVPTGYQKIAQFTINSYDDTYSNAFEKMYFYDLKNRNEKIERNFDYKYKTTKLIDVNDYEEVCFTNTDKNGTKYNVCSREIIGTHKEEIEFWEYLNTTTLQKGKIVIGIFTDVQKGDKIEWIPTLFGKIIDEWAIWVGTGEYIENNHGITIKINEGAGNSVDGLLGTIRWDNITSYVVQKANTVPSATGCSLYFNGNMTPIVNGTFSGNNCSLMLSEPLPSGSVVVWNIWGAGVIERQRSSVLNPYPITFSPIFLNASTYSFFSTRTDVVFQIQAIWTEIAEEQKITKVTLNSPENYFNTSIPTIVFNVTATDYKIGGGITNVSLYLDGVINETNTSGVNGTYEFTKTLSEGEHYWSILAYDNDSNPTQSGDRYFTIDYTNPVLSTTGITDKYNSTLPINLTWSLFNADLHPDQCWYYTSENSTNISVTCNSSTITNFTSDGSKTIYYFGNDSIGNEASGSATLNIGYYPYTQNTNKADVGSGDSVVFTLYVNGTDVSNQFSSTTATLMFNGTTYTPDTTDRTNQNYTKFTKTLYTTIGNSTGANTPYNWSYSIKNTTDIPLNVTTTTNTIKVYTMAVRECLAGDRYILNASIKDEKLKSLINASLNTTNIEIDLSISSRANTSATWNFSKTWINNNTVYVCVPPNVLTYSSYKIDWTIGYSADDYVQEFYYMDNGTIDSTNYFNSYTTNPLSLYDLALVDSTTFLFSFKDEDNLEVDDAIIHVYRYYIGDGVFREVERAKQDNNGETHVHLVEEDVIYYFLITQYGNIIYTSSEYNAKCLDTPCQIELTASTDFVEFPTDYNKINGTSYTLTSSKTTRTVTLNYGSNATQVVNLSLFKVVNGVVTYINTTSETGTSGSLTLSVPLSQGNETFFASIFANGEWIRSEWIDMKEKAQDYFGTTGAILGGLLVLTLIFMAISEGVMLIVVGIVAIFVIVAMQLVDMSWLAIISIVVAGALIIWKMTNGGNKR